MEIYTCAPDDPTEKLKRFLREQRPDAPSFDGCIYTKSGEEAIRHLCMVAAGLDSMVVKGGVKLDQCGGVKVDQRRE
jgi:glutamyl-tRNA reductase